MGAGEGGAPMSGDSQPKNDHLCFKSFVETDSSYGHGTKTDDLQRKRLRSCLAGAATRTRAGRARPFPGRAVDRLLTTIRSNSPHGWVGHTCISAAC